ncbi:DUF3093 domain-containing protein [Frigoribacterium sp. CG_9.8]|uniref:DUF3093 domain-containing protein n=1 Tax=Frigoribacterium sp. CG_9.8 TaxID=2787733 RepID=UPI001A278775|nr:DUF3093 domain-containing protein [Frigoribacterium sp. CG_9.8]MBG6108020.1 hypothetical protein [Frigoribacterium sp. CG_9.8]
MTQNPPGGPTILSTLYHERIWPSHWVFLATALVVPASLLVFLPINLLAGAIVALVLYAMVVLVLVATSPVIEVSRGELIAGRARVSVHLIGTVTVFRGEEATLQRGRLLDARAWLLIRGWVSPVAKIEVTDETDPTPYWIVSTRTPDALAAAIEAARAG